MIVAGIDVGALTTKVVILEEGGKILASNCIPTGSNSEKAARRAMDLALENCLLKLKDINYLVATGYGRISVSFSHRQVTEISCHAKGAFSLFPHTRTVIDIGGQDSKVIRLNGKGRVVDFAMNDKCAAGTGRFLEVMAQALEIPLESLGNISQRSKKPVAISSMCTVFAESEVVSLIAQGVPQEDIVQGLHNAIGERIVALIQRVGIEEPLTMTGGVAKNAGVVRALEEKLKVKLNIPGEPQIVGAYGAALLALEISKEI